MSTARKIYTEREWGAADSLDRLYIHLMEPERWELTHEEDELLDNLRKVWAIVCEKSTQRARVRLISEQIAVSERTVQRYIQQAILLFGDILKVDTDLELALAHERYMKLYKLAMKDDDYDTAMKCQCYALAVLEKIDARRPREAKKYTAITFTSDPSALRARNGDAETLDFDELPAHATESVLERQAVGVPAGD